MKKILGIDVGITSVGWGIIDEENNIVDCGVRLFDELRVDSNLNRRSMRGSRRVVRRRKQRILDMRKLLIDSGVINNDFHVSSNPYHLRLKGLKEKLTNDELATVLLNYAKRRGSSLEVVEEVSGKEESTKTLLSRNQQGLDKQKYVVKVQLERLKEEGKLRGSSNVFKTSDYEKEIRDLLDIQKLDKDLKDKIIQIITRRRHFSEGPGSLKTPTMYGRYRTLSNEQKEKLLSTLTKDQLQKIGKERFDVIWEDTEYTIFKNKTIVNKKPYDLIALMRGKCSIYPDELRAPKQSFSAELFNFLNDLNNLTILNREEQKITKEEKEEIVSVIREKGNITINQLLKLLNAEPVEVKGFRLNTSEKPIITEFVGYKKLLKIFEEHNLKPYEDYLLDGIVEILTETVVESERYDKIFKLIKNQELATSFSNLTGVSQYHSLSLKAIYLLNDEMMETSLNQQQIITEKELVEDIKIDKLTLDNTLILSPTAKRAHREALKVIEELIKIHGNFDRIVIETTRDKNSDDQKKKRRESDQYFKSLKTEAEEALGEYGEENVTSANVLKFRLYKEQDGKCAYSGKEIDLGTLIRNPESYQVDHIIPLSISHDDSHDNKVLILPIENQRKGNKTPFGYFSSGLADKQNPINSWEKFELYVKNNKKYKNTKRQNLLFMKDITKYDVLMEFVNRNIVDTSYAVRSLMTTLKNYFNYNNIKTNVFTIRGKQTNLFRKIGRNMWNRDNPNQGDNNPLKKDRDKYMHHAIDALLIAGFANRSSIRQLYDLVIKEEGSISQEQTGEVPEIADYSSESKSRMLLKRIAEVKEAEVKFSWKIDTKANRRVSDQTIYSTRIIEGEHVIVKKFTNIYELQSQRLNDYIYGKNKDRLLVSKHDEQTFEILKKAYDQYKHEKYPYQAFRNDHGPLRKYSKKGNGPEIKQLKYLENKLGNYIDITPSEALDKKVVLLQISPFRADIYYSESENRYRFVTVRYNDIKKFDNHFEIDEKRYQEAKKEKQINNTYEFMFSLYRNNIVNITRKNKDIFLSEIKRFLTIYSDRTNVLEVKPIESFPPKRQTVSIGPSIIKICKYNVSPAGIMSKVIKEDLKLKF